MISKKVAHALLVSAVSLTVSGAASAMDDHAAPPEMEKCYGVAKAGKNDCASKNGTHACGGHAEADSDANEFVLVPKGVCDKLVGGTLADAAPAAEAPAEGEAH